MDPLLQAMAAIAEAAGDVLLDYCQDPRLPVDWKPDASPVSAADRAAHQLIHAALVALGDWPVLSEEGVIPDWEERRHWSRYWLVDPLDGTREFLDGRDGFAVHIALIAQGRPLLGVVCQPARAWLWAGQPGLGAWQRPVGGDWQPLATRRVAGALTVLASRHRPGRGWPQLLAHLRERHAVDEQHCSGSTKYCRIAAGEADLYPCLVPVSEWDTAAPQAVVEGAGGVVCDAGHRPLAYNRKPDLRQPPFYAAGDPCYWSRRLQLAP